MEPTTEPTIKDTVDLTEPDSQTNTKTADDEVTESRRKLLRMLIGRTSLAGFGLTAAACNVTSPPVDLETRMLQRLTFGISATAKQHMASIGPLQWLDDQLAMGQAESSALSQTLLSSYPTLEYTEVNNPGSSEDFYSHFQSLGPLSLEDAVVELILYGAQLAPAAITRMVSSEAQLYERMVDFWNDHFNVSQFDVLFQWKTVYENTAIRPHALGTFRDLLEKTATSVAMLKYLNNEQNMKDAINENYARELLELHTLGVGSTYTEGDIREAANLLTGWGVDPLEAGGPGWNWASVYDAGNQAAFATPVFGWTNPGNATGAAAIIGFLDYLAGHADTKTYICTKLIARFISEDTASYSGLLSDMTAAWGTYGDIQAVLRAMIKVNSGTSSPLVSAPPKFQRPLDYTVACLRALGLEVHVPWATSGLFSKEVTYGMGQIPHAWPAPDGYSDTEEDWLNPAIFDYRWRIVEKFVASIDTQTTGPYDDSLSVADPYMQLHVLAAIGGSNATNPGFPAEDTFRWFYSTLIGGEATADGLELLSFNTGWELNYVPTEAELKASLPSMIMIVLASRDKQYR